MLKSLIVSIVLGIGTAYAVPVMAEDAPRPLSDMESERGRDTGIKCPYMGV